VNQIASTNRHSKLTNVYANVHLSHNHVSDRDPPDLYAVDGFSFGKIGVEARADNHWLNPNEL
jgi:hypothetical protein